ncbi:MAG TPA: O-antigen ligase family protein [Chloroflexota bacterium]|nr:O-antigen ligase family protein [Chloroflexota bacterium]
MNETSHPWGAARALLAALLLGYAWRLQDLFPVVDPLKPVTLATGAFLIVLLLDRRLPAEFVTVARRPPALFGVILGALAFAGVPFSLYPGMSLSFALQNVLPAVVLMIGIAAAIEYSLDAYRLSAVHVIGALVFSVVVLTRYNVGPDGRLGDLAYYDANGLGFILVCALPLTEWCAQHSIRREARLGALAAIAVLLVTIVRTGSRGAFLGLAAVVAYGVFANRSAPLRRRFGLALLSGLLLVGAGGKNYWTMMDTILHPTQDYNWEGNSEGGRMSVWKRGIGYMIDRPLTGVGAGAFSVAEGTISPLANVQQYGVGLKWSVAHNSFVQVGAELGFPGLLAFMALLFVGLGRARRAVVLGLAVGDRRAAAMGDALAASLVGYAVSGFFLSEGFSALPYSIVGIAIGLHAALTRQASGALQVAPASVAVPEIGRAAIEWSAWNSDA